MVNVDSTIIYILIEHIEFLKLLSKAINTNTNNSNNTKLANLEQDVLVDNNKGSKAKAETKAKQTVAALKVTFVLCSKGRPKGSKNKKVILANLD